MDVVRHSSKPSSTGVMPFIAGLVSGRVLGGIAHTMLSMSAWRGTTRPVNPIQVRTYLKGVDYPTGKRGLLARVQAAGADAPVLETLTHLPEQRYTSPIKVSRALGQRGTSAAGASP
jgi:Protein of unknown function (DUF2795)